ncbi:MAG: fimbrial protein FimV [Rhodoferax sp.]|nr:FimV/HubP family polar landmark protein [Rhodoferax sp.]MBP9147527.1 fimbrial protein FimV [Rhodoferax sp.]MBP9736535.1 fimbrial protein FimV [Rhodoferax sp.]
MAKSQQWQFSAIALAALLGLWGSNAIALSLGRINVQSALGEPLVAEIEILDINADEAASFSTRIAPPESFKTAGLEYNPALGSLQAVLQFRPNGRSFIKLSTDRAINEPFVDMLVETSWSSGRIVRDYTMLFDPPSLRDANVAIAAIGVTPAAQARSRPAQPAAAPPIAPPAIANPVTRPEPAVAAARPVEPVAARPIAPSPVPARPPAPASVEKTLTVKPGDTAGRIAVAHKPATVSLDQMLVALMRANPDAFIQNNVNRIKAGAIVDLPSEAQAQSTSAQEARQIIIAQSADFNNFRRKFAANAPTAAVAPAARELSGKVQTAVEEKKPSAAATDRLTLSKGAIQGKGSEAELANQRNARETANRAAELAKNLSDLNKLAAASSASTSGSSAASSPTQPSLPAIVAAPVTVAPASAVAPVEAVSAPAPAPLSIASAPEPASSAASAAASKAATPASAAPEVPTTEPGFLDSLLDNPLVPGGVAALLIALAGLAFFKVRQRKAATESDTNLDAPPEFLLNASGGRNVDTSDDVSTGSSMVYSPSQLDAADEVDPVAEADVYMAYGRDLQAEEILKDALRSTPDRLAIHHKLLEIYAKRGDAKAFESIATLAFNLTDGTGTDWERVSEMGLAIDPDNALYLPGGAPLTKSSPLTGPAPFDMDEDPTTAPYVAKAQPDKPAGASSFVDLDLDLDFSDEPAGTPALALPVAPAHDQPEAIQADLPEMEAEPAPPELPSVADTEPELSIEGLDFSLPEPEPPASAPAAPERATPDPDLVDFDLGSLALDMGEEPITVAGDLPDGQDPLETKLALAEEFLAIGDDDGARALIEEVIAEASGDMKSKAERALDKL